MAKRGKRPRNSAISQISLDEFSTRARKSWPLEMTEALFLFGIPVDPYSYSQSQRQTNVPFVDTRISWQRFSSWPHGSLDNLEKKRDSARDGRCRMAD